MKDKIIKYRFKNDKKILTFFGSLGLLHKYYPKAIVIETRKIN